MTDGEWATPGSAAPQPAAARVAVSASAAGPTPTSGGGPPPRPLPMRPQSTLEVLDSGFAIIRARPGLVLGLAAVFMVPLSLVSAWVRRDETGRDGSELFDDPQLFAIVSPGDGPAAFLVSVLGRSLAQTVVAFAIGRLVAAWYADREADLTEILGWVLRRLPVIATAWLLAHLLQAAGLVVFVVGALIVAMFTVVVAPVLAVEQVGPIAALRRSFRLVSGRFVPVAVFFVGSGVLAEFLGVILGLLPTLLGYLLTIGGGWLLVAVGNVIAGIVSTSFLAAATVALYLDLRVRREGIDLQLLIPDLFAPAETP